MTNQQRLREQLVLGVDEEGLEELTLRLALPEYPRAHRTRRGRDGGIDVLSNHEVPAARAWQGKNYTDGDVDWSKCRDSIKAARENPAKPRHYTFVFPRALRASERNYWRDTFAPWVRQEWPELEELDYWDNLAWRLEDRSDIVDLLMDGGLGGYVRGVVGPLGPQSPIANSEELAIGIRDADPIELGRLDPRYAYGRTRREAHDGDADLPDQRVRFTMNHGQAAELPQFAITLRDGDVVDEITASPRAGADVGQPAIIFDDNAEGERSLAEARASLAKATPTTVDSRFARLAPGHVPDHFRDQLDADGFLGRGAIELGLSAPLTLTVELDTTQGTVIDEISLYRVPSPPGAVHSYAGSVGVAILAIDVFPSAAREGESGDRNWYEAVLTVTLEPYGEPPLMALRGLGFAKGFQDAHHVRLNAPGLLAQPMEWDGPTPMEPEAAEIWEVAVTIAAALDGLNGRDGRSRVMPSAIDPRHFAIATMVATMLRDGDVRVHPETEEFEVGLPPDAAEDDDPKQWLDFEDQLPDLFGVPTLRVRQKVLKATALGVHSTGTRTILTCRHDGEAAIIVMPADANRTDL